MFHHSFNNDICIVTQILDTNNNIQIHCYNLNPFCNALRLKIVLY
jgi:hypothetical protein